MKVLMCDLEWRYGSDGKIAYLTFTSSATGTALMLRRDFFNRLPPAMIERIHALTKNVAVPTTLAAREKFKGWLKASFPVDQLKQLKRIYDEQMFESQKGAAR